VQLTAIETDRELFHGGVLILRESFKEGNIMNRTFYSVSIVSAVLMLGVTVPSVYAQPGKSGGSHAGGTAASHMSEKGLENTNAQWSTDPERGQARAEERHELHKKGKSQATKKQLGDLPAKAKSGARD
jgi:hypothetical protein